MEVTEKIVIAERTLAKNPLLVSFYYADGVTLSYRIYTSDKLIYTGCISILNDYVRVNISDLFESLLPAAGVLNCKVQFSYSEEYEKTFTVYGGGISKLMQRKLAASNTDIFSWKLKNINTNFFLTTRTNARIIRIPEDELMPLAYYAKGMNFIVKVNGDTVATYDHGADAGESLKALDLGALRRQLMTDIGKLVSAFDIMTSTGGFASTIVITEVQDHNIYFLKFLNSWGVSEKIAISGLIEFNPSYNEPEEVAKYDTIIQDSVLAPKRKTVTNSYKASVGYKSPDERLFLIDALLSDKCYLVASGLEMAVKVTGGDAVLQDTGTEPKDVSINLELLDKDTFYSPLLNEADYAILAANDRAAVTQNNGTNILG